MGSIDHSSRYKLEIYVLGHTKEKPALAQQIATFPRICTAMKSQKIQQNLSENGMFIYSKSKFKVTSKNTKTSIVGTQDSYQTETEKFQTLKSPLLFSHQNTLNCHPEHLESTSCNKTIRRASEWFILAQIRQKLRVCQPKVHYIHTTHLSGLKTLSEGKPMDCDKISYWVSNSFQVTCPVFHTIFQRMTLS